MRMHWMGFALAMTMACVMAADVQDVQELDRGRAEEAVLSIGTHS